MSALCRELIITLKSIFKEFHQDILKIIKLLTYPLWSFRKSRNVCVDCFQLYWIRVFFVLGYKTFSLSFLLSLCVVCKSQAHWLLTSSVNMSMKMDSWQFWVRRNLCPGKRVLWVWWAITAWALVLQRGDHESPPCWQCIEFPEAWSIEGRRRRGWQRMRWLDGISNSMDVSLSKFQ